MRFARSALRRAAIAAIDATMALGLTLSCWACGGSAPPPKPECDKIESVLVGFSPSTQLNHGRDGHPRSVQVRVYQLRTPQVFDQAQYDEIWHGDDRGLLGGELVGGPDELTVIPGRPQTHDMTRHPEARFLGVAARFRQTQSMFWKAIAPLPSPRDPCEDGYQPARVSWALINSTIQLQEHR